MNKMLGAVARGVVVSLALAGLASVSGRPGGGGHRAAGGRARRRRERQPGRHHPTHARTATRRPWSTSGSRVIVGGKFAQVKRYNQAALFTRNNIFAYDKATGAIDTTFVPQLDGQVTAMLKAADGNIYVAGQFKNVNGVAGGYLVKLNPVTGQKVTAFNAHSRTGWSTTSTSTATCCSPEAPSPRSATSCARTSRCSTPRPARPSAPTCPSPRRSPAPPGSCASTSAPTAPHLVVIGNFTQVGGQYRPNIARLDISRHHRHRELVVHRRLPLRGLCSSGYDTFIRDVDFSPDGSYFAIVATGAYFGSDKPVRHRQPLGDLGHRHRLAHLGGPHRWRHAHGRRHHRRGHLRGRAPALGEQRDPAER